MQKQVNFRGFKCVVDTTKTYRNERPAIILTDAEDGSGVAYASVNVPNVELDHGEVAIKNYSENEGILNVLVQADIISEPIRKERISPFIEVEICKILNQEI